MSIIIVDTSKNEHYNENIIRNDQLKAFKSIMNIHLLDLEEAAMYGVERKSAILRLVEDKNRVDVQELSQLFQVSESTIRRDLREMEEAGAIKRTHGGALPVKNVNFEPSISEKKVSSMKEKKAIARKALEFIRDGDTIILDSGTTTAYLMRELGVFSNLTVVTNSLMLSSEWEYHPGIEVVVLGGVYRPGVMSLVGPFAEKCLETIKVDKAFMATNGIDHREGLTTPNLLEADIKRKMISRSDQVILMADSTKFNQISFSRFADLNDVSVCITDNGIPQDYLARFEGKLIRVEVVKPEEDGTA